jgi:hypothetical protein
MLRWIVLALVVVGLTAAATLLSLYVPEPGAGTVLSAAERNGPQPKVEVEEPLVHDFGVMAQQDKGVHSWKVKNVGEGELEMWMDSSTCSCTIAKLKSEDGKTKPKVVVKPGDSTTIDLEWETRNNQNDYVKGATIATNDPSRPLFKLDVKGKVFPPIVIYPPEMIRFEAISNEEPNGQSVGVFSYDRPSTKVTKLTTSRPELIVAKQVAFTDKDRQHLKIKSGGCRVDVEVKPGMPVGSFQEELVIETDHPLQPVVKVSIAIRTTGPISIVPMGLRLTDVTSKKGITRDLAILVRGGRPTKFEVVRKPDKLEVSIEPSATETQKGRYLLRISVPPGTAPGHVEDSIIIKTDHPHASEIKIPVNILISNVAG